MASAPQLIQSITPAGALGTVLRAVLCARRDLGLVDVALVVRLEPACLGFEASGFNWDGALDSAALLVAAVECIGGGATASEGRHAFEVHPAGAISAAGHLVATMELRKRLLPALYQLEALLERDAGSSPAAAERITHIERARRRVSAAAESLREVALGDPPIDPRFAGIDQQVAPRALGYINEWHKVQLKVAAGSLQPGGTWDAALEALAQLQVVETVLGGESAVAAEPRPEAGGWPHLVERLVGTIDRVWSVAAAVSRS